MENLANLKSNEMRKDIQFSETGKFGWKGMS